MGMRAVRPDCPESPDLYRTHKKHVHVLGGYRAPSTANDQDVGHVAVVEDDPRCTFVLRRGEDDDGERIDWLLAFRKFRLTHPDIYHFVAFWCDRRLASIASQDAGFYYGLANPAKGINWKPDVPTHRKGWGTRRLQAFMYFDADDDATLLQEIGHHWMAYTGFKYRREERAAHYDLLRHDCAHWSSYFDNDRSPMDYDDSDLPDGASVDWTDHGDGTFTTHRVRRGQFAYCNLDLYLMGLIPPGEVGEFYLIGDPRRRGRKGEVRGKRVTLTVQNIVLANGKRRPSSEDSPKRFKIAFVLLTREARRAATRVRHVNRIRERFAQIFRKATGGRAEVDTRLSP